MYNLSIDEISMVDGGGDGNSVVGGGNGHIAQTVCGFVGVAVTSRAGPYAGALAVGMCNAATSSGSYGNNSGVGTGTNQSYGGNGLDSGGGMMQAGGSRGGYGY